VKNNNQDTKMIPGIDIDNVEDMNDGSVVVSAVITNVGAAPCITSEASLANMHSEDVVPETRGSGASSGFTRPTDKKNLSIDHL
jgi:exosome complex exonuclease RRP6